MKLSSSPYLFLLIILVVALAVPSFWKYPFENFENQYTLATPGHYPQSLDKRDLDQFPSSGRKTVSNDSGSTIWWHYPIFEVGSFAQITNNIRYPNNPDNGRCMSAEFCGALYKDNKNRPSNYVHPIAPTCYDADGKRINYYNTSPNLLTFTNTDNILY